MSNRFVRYAPDIEEIDPPFRRAAGEDRRFLGEEGPRIPASEGTGRAVRGAHAKTFGVVEANVDLLDGSQPNMRRESTGSPGSTGR